MSGLDAGGYRVYPADPALSDWAAAALRVAEETTVDRALLRHGETWYPGVDALHNAPDGSVSGVPLGGGWRDDVDLPDHWHRAQLSMVYPGYPRQDVDESDGAHRYRIRRAAAHVDGLLPTGPERRRFLREPHGFILGLPLNSVQKAPLMVWPGSHLILQRAFRAAAQGRDVSQLDLTETYHLARREVFETIAPLPLRALPGQAMLLHRHLLHGVAPWGEIEAADSAPRIVAYFRPHLDAGPQGWLDLP
ncbi:hypothetical protein ACFSUD_04795 [Sulfitobacter aestuarii]|uniref:Phytanoyl-CoA dioxygenase (PhyH) n=1 Tax=Sulfitobacter aestuarii TaxID=2161676 RepID=A0ABW5U0C3_9RHOB